MQLIRSIVYSAFLMQVSIVLATSALGGLVVCLGEQGHMALEAEHAHAHCHTSHGGDEHGTHADTAAEPDQTETCSGRCDDLPIPNQPWTLLGGQDTQQPPSILLALIPSPTHALWRLRLPAGTSPRNEQPPDIRQPGSKAPQCTILRT